jgi:sulfite reductase alpha subunit-like flavoprotein
MAEIMGARPTLLELLTRFPSCRPPLAHLLSELPAMQPRLYSIACSPIWCAKHHRT